MSSTPVQHEWETVPLRYVCQLNPSVDFGEFEEDDELTFLPMDLGTRNTLLCDFMHCMTAVSLEMSDEPKIILCFDKSTNKP